MVVKLTATTSRRTPSTTGYNLPEVWECECEWLESLENKSVPPAQMIKEIQPRKSFILDVAQVPQVTVQKMSYVDII